MKKYNAPEIKVAEIRNQAILAGSISISNTPVNPSTALSKKNDIDFDSDDEI